MSADILNERYQIKRILGRNGRIVYEAFDLFSNTTVRIHAYQLRGLDVISFREALMVAQQLHHPNIRKLLDAWIDEDKGYIVVEWVGTYTLKDYVQMSGTYDTLAARVNIIVQIGATIEWLLMKGSQVVNLHPIHIILDEHNTPFLEPFMWNPAPRDRQRIGARPHYLAPEVIMGQPNTVRAIQYLLGTMAYELLSGGKMPFRAIGRLLRGFMKKVTNDPEPIRSHAPDLPVGFDDIFDKVLARQPEDRYPSCFAFIDALREALDGE